MIVIDKKEGIRLRPETLNDEVLLEKISDNRNDQEFFNNLLKAIENGGI